MRPGQYHGVLRRHAHPSYATSLYYGPGSPVFTYATGACGNLVTAAFTFAWNIPLFAISVPLSAAACFP